MDGSGEQTGARHPPLQLEHQPVDFPTCLGHRFLRFAQARQTSMSTHASWSSWPDFGQQNTYHSWLQEPLMLCEGSAFQRVMRVEASKLKANSVEGVKALVTALGGIWGKTSLEDRFERF